ncbi:universal stress protein [Kribbella sp. NPDC000426]|uniref:universal stress protein n=1 Tax=Kribbella sp. NPDC000426 TaxID=3154255 RepID=UPI00332A0E86
MPRCRRGLIPPTSICVCPESPFHTKFVRNDPAQALIDESADAGLVVVGAHKPEELAGARLGSVSQAVLECAACPVAVVHPRQAFGGGSWQPLVQEESCVSS